jgi:Ankyrin repeats (3 copies)
MVDDINNESDDVSFNEIQESGGVDDGNNNVGGGGSSSTPVGGTNGTARASGSSVGNSGSSTGNNNTNNSNPNVVPDIMLLNMFCARAKAPRDPTSADDRMEAELSWEPVREWLSSHDADEVRLAAEQLGESGLTALHFACRHVPPLDVIDVLLSVAAETTTQWPDSFGWLPIHYACASGSSSEVIKALVEAYPESKTTVDRRGRTPLHFALGDKPASPDIVFLLGSSGAASYPDEIGMLVRHIWNTIRYCISSGNRKL